MSSDCEKMKDQIADHITGILSEAQVQLLELHLNECTSCREYARALKEEDALLTELFAEIETDMTNRQDQILRKVNQLCVSKQTESPFIRRIIMKNQITKYAAVIALICTGVVAATAVGVKIHKWRVESKHPEYGYMLHSEDGKTVTNIPDSWADNPEHAVEVKEELDLLKQQDKRELVGAGEYIVNGQLDNRWLSYEYNLSDGQTIKVSERDPDDNGPGALTREQKEEMDQLWHEQLDTEYWQDFVTTEEKQVYGSALSFKKWKLVLSDGTEVIYSIGSLKKDQ